MVLVFEYPILTLNDYNSRKKYNTQSQFFCKAISTLAYFKTQLFYE